MRDVPQEGDMLCEATTEIGSKCFKMGGRGFGEFSSPQHSTCCALEHRLTSLLDSPSVVSHQAVDLGAKVAVLLQAALEVPGFPS